MLQQSHLLVGSVIPVGGTREGTHQRTALIPGDLYMDKLSNLPVRVGGAIVSQSNVFPSCGSHQAMLDGTTLACEARVLDCLRAYKDRVAGLLEALDDVILTFIEVHACLFSCKGPDSLSAGAKTSARAEQVSLESALKDLERARERMKLQLLTSQHDLKRREERAVVLAATGGSPGPHHFSHLYRLHSII